MSAVDWIKWLIAAALVAAGIYGFYYFQEQTFTWVRMLGMVAMVAIAAGVGATTEHGRAFTSFMKAANIERQKVVWPTRAETVQTTIVVMVVVILVGIFIWILDWIFSQLVSWLVG
ncbi:MAG: preprotein translocase subunit SecE [Xanthomonadales bacterium]|nr:preprotein translocase subunit SecE [Xanthomonadales bacterium]